MGGGKRTATVFTLSLRSNKTRLHVKIDTSAELYGCVNITLKGLSQVWKGKFPADTSGALFSFGIDFHSSFSNNFEIERDWKIQVVKKIYDFFSTGTWQELLKLVETWLIMREGNFGGKFGDVKSTSFKLSLISNEICLYENN